MKKSLLLFVLPLLMFGCMSELMSDVSSGLGNDIDAVVEQFENTKLSDTGYVMGYRSENLEFQYFVNEEYGYWGGFAIASLFDMENGNPENQYSVYNNRAVSGNNYLLYYYDSYNEPCDILCRYHGDYQFATVCLNLSTYTYHSITNEDANPYAREFADGDYLKVVFTALMENKVEGESVECYVVDYRDGKRYVATNWDAFDISALSGRMWGIRVRIETSDVGEWGANTPLYICMDNLVYTCDRR